MKKIKYLILLLILIALFVIPNISYTIQNNNFQHLSTQGEIKIEDIQQEYNNNDIIAILSIPNSNIYEPIVKTDNNTYYLNHNLKKEKSIIGSVFMDYRINLNSKKILIYGHNSTFYNPPFRELENYYDETYYQEHQTINIITSDNISEYQIFSIFIEYEDWTYMNLSFNEKEWLVHLEKLKSKSWYTSDIDLTKNDEILILQTCSHHTKYSQYKDKYLLVIAKKLK